MILDKLVAAGAAHPPKWLPGQTAYLTMMGSNAYGVSADTSDMDIYGFCVPPKEDIFPHLQGVIPGFGEQPKRFEQWQHHHIKNPDGKDQTYDFAVFSIVKYFQLCMDNNPNMLNSLFTPRRCVLHTTPVAEMVRERRREFLHKGCWPKFKGYAYGQMGKIRDKTASLNPARAESIAEHGYDLKYAYHTVRLLNEVEQILVEGDLDIERNREQLKSIRRGDWKFEDLERYFTEKEHSLEKQYAESKLPEQANERALKALLLDCLENYYGSMAVVVQRDPSIDQLVRDIDGLLSKYR
jgi:predicted nucleotidyltransferase